MNLNKASEVYDFYLEEIEKAKYIKRTGSPGNYKYVYPGGEKKGQSGKKVVENSGSKVTNKQESEGDKKMKQNWDKNTIVTVERYKTKDGLGLGIFKNKKTGEIILDETRGKKVIPQYTTATGKASDFGSLRSLLKIDHKQPSSAKYTTDWDKKIQS